MVKSRNTSLRSPPSSVQGKELTTAARDGETKKMGNAITRFIPVSALAWPFLAVFSLVVSTAFALEKTGEERGRYPTGFGSWGEGQVETTEKDNPRVLHTKPCRQVIPT